MNICISLCTRNRPEMLRRCLTSLVPEAATEGVQVSVVVVENDPEPHQQKLVEGFQGTLDIHYAQEAEPGIPFARNRGVEIALGLQADWIIFIDDDEEAKPGWLAAFIAAAARFDDADVLVGPVDITYPPDAPAWLPKSKMVGIATGTAMESAYTSNTMAARRIFAADGMGLRFEERLRYTGGSDTELFLRVTAAGGKILWVEDALVREEYPESRAQLSWYLRRYIRRANGGVLIQRLHGKQTLGYAAGRIAKCLIVTGGCFVKAAAFSVVDRAKASEKFGKGVLSLASAYGYLLGVFHIHPNPYKVIEGH